MNWKLLALGKGFLEKNWRDVAAQESIQSCFELSIHLSEERTSRELLLKIVRGKKRPGALKFLLWSLEPYHFTDWSPDPFMTVEPGAQRHFARSPEPSIFKFDHSSSQIALILVGYCLFVFVCAC